MDPLGEPQLSKCLVKCALGAECWLRRHSCHHSCTGPGVRRRSWSSCSPGGSVCVHLRAAIQDQSSSLSSLTDLLSRLFLSGTICFAPTPLPISACLAWKHCLEFYTASSKRGAPQLLTIPYTRSTRNRWKQKSYWCWFQWDWVALVAYSNSEMNGWVDWWKATVKPYFPKPF